MMNRRIFIGVFPAALGLVRTALGQTLPDFSGLWILDPSRSDGSPYGQLRVIRQHADAVDFTAIQSIGSPSVPALHVIPWKLRFNRWGPRRGPEDSREPKVQARRDGNKLRPDELLVEEVNWTSIPSSFDFRERSISRAYVRRRHYYRRVPDVVDWSPEPSGQPVTLRLTPDELKVTCRTKQCKAYEIVAGRRSSARNYAESDVLTLSLAAQTTIEFGSR